MNLGESNKEVFVNNTYEKSKRDLCLRFAQNLKKLKNDKGFLVKYFINVGYKYQDNSYVKIGKGTNEVIVTYPSEEYFVDCLLRYHTPLLVEIEKDLAEMLVQERLREDLV